VKSSALVIALDVAEQSLIDTTAKLPGKFDALRQAVINTDTSMLKLSGSTVIVKDRLDRLEQSLIKGTTESQDFKNITASVGGAVKSAGDKLKEYRSQVDKTTSSERSLTSAQRSRASAQKSLNQANEQLLDAQTAFNKAVAGYGAGSAEANDAERELNRAQRERERAGYAVEESVFAVADAEKNLSDARKDPQTTPQRIRELEIQLAEAKLRVADATDSQLEVTNKLSLAQQKLNEVVSGALPDSTTYRTLLDGVNDAKEKQEEASYRLSDAIYAEETAIKALKRAYRELATAAEAAGRTVNIPAVPPPGASSSPGGFGNGQRNMPDKVDITVNSSIVNPLQVAQEIQDYLDQLNRAYGTYAV
jgi:chromosome segregation ATPase